MSFDPDSPTPPGRQLADYLAGQIRTGVLPPGTQLPTKAQLAQTWGVAGATVDGALKKLKADGLVVGRQGAGVYVKTAPPAGPPTIEERLERIEALLEQVLRKLDD